MKKLVLFATVCVLVLLSAAGAVASGAAGPGKPNVVLQFLDIQTTFRVSIPLNQRPKLGDRFWFEDDIYAWRGTRRGARVGRADVTGVFLDPPNLVQISATAHLPGGTLDIFGIGNGGRVQKFAVIGGTGVYAAARGELWVRTLGGQNSTHSAITIRLWT